MSLFYHFICNAIYKQLELIPKYIIIVICSTP